MIKLTWYKRKTPQEHVTESKVSRVLSMSKSYGEQMSSSQLQNDETVGAAVTKSGRAFHVPMAAPGNARSASVARRVTGTTKAVFTLRTTPNDIVRCRAQCEHNRLTLTMRTGFQLVRCFQLL